MPGSGKSTVGKLLAEKLNRQFLDLDKEIERMAGWYITDIFDQLGEDYFRELEKSVLLMLIRLNEPAVIATGGGAPCFFDNMDLMKKSGPTIFLDTPLDQLVARVMKDKSTRPLVSQMTDDQVENDMKALYEKRKSDYNQATVNATSDLADVMDALDTYLKN